MIARLLLVLFTLTLPLQAIAAEKAPSPTTKSTTSVPAYLASGHFWSQVKAWTNESHRSTMMIDDPRQELMAGACKESLERYSCETAHVFTKLDYTGNDDEKLMSNPIKIFIADVAYKACGEYCADGVLIMCQSKEDASTIWGFIGQKAMPTPGAKVAELKTFGGCE